MVIVHIEIVALEGVPVRTCIDRIQIDITSGITILIGCKVDDHFEGSDMAALENDIFAIGADLGAAHIRRVIVASVWDLSVEEEFQGSLGPRQVRVLARVEVAPDPIGGALGDVALEKSH